MAPQFWPPAPRSSFILRFLTEENIVSNCDRTTSSSDLSSSKVGLSFNLMSLRKQLLGLGLLSAKEEAASISKVESPKEIMFVIVD